jgi:hypothetical protein
MTSNAAPIYRAVPATAAQADAPRYVYEQTAPSAMEGLLMSVFSPGVNSSTLLVLNGTLGALAVVIGLMLACFDTAAVSETFSMQLWIFLAITLALILSVNWLVLRFGAALNEAADQQDDEEEEGEEEEEEEVQSEKLQEQKKQPKLAAPSKQAAPVAAAAEEVDEEPSAAPAPQQRSAAAGAKKKSRKVHD